MKSLGPYVLERKLGSGGMGVVYLARHPELGVRALKLIHTHLSDHAALARFEREFQALAAVAKHPHVVPVHTAGFDDGRLYYVMEAIDGQDLDARLQSGPLPPREAASLVAAIADAVAALHAAGVLHRDLKPANVLLDRRGHPYLTDFGLARILGDEAGRLTMTGELLGTPDYMAPEQALGLKQLGPAVDVYALGLILFATLSGQRALQGRQRMEVLQNAAQGNTLRLGEVAPGTPQELVAWVERCLVYEAGARPSAAELRDGLRAWLGRQAPSPTAGEVQRRERSHLRLALVACLALAGVLAAGLVVALAQRRARWEAARERVVAGVEGVEAALAGGAALDPADPLRALAREWERLAPPDAAAREERSAELASLWAAAADRAARAGDAPACAQALEACQPPERQAREQRRRLDAHVCAARTWLHLEGHLAAADSEELRRELGKARERWPERGDLVALAARLALSLGRTAEARKLLSEHPHVSPALRLEVALGDDDAGELAAALAGEGLPPRLVAQAELRLAAAELVSALPSALARTRRACALQVAGLEADRERLRALAQGELDKRAAGWGRLPPEQMVPLFLARVQLHELLDTLDPAYVLPDAEVTELSVAIINVGPQLPDRERSCADLLARAIRVGPERPALFTWYGRYAVSQPDDAIYRRGLELTDGDASLYASYGRALSWQGREQELRDLIAECEARHGEQYSGQLAVMVGALGGLLNGKANAAPKGSPERQALLEEVLGVWERTIALDPTTRHAMISGLRVIELLDEEFELLPALRERALRLARQYLEQSEGSLSALMPSLPSHVERVARLLLEWSPPEARAEALARVDRVLGQYPVMLWLALRRLELALAGGEDAAAVCDRLDLPGRLEQRRELLATRVRADGARPWAYDEAALTLLGQRLPELEARLRQGDGEAARALLGELRSALREDRDTWHLYGGDSGRRL